MNLPVIVFGVIVTGLVFVAVYYLLIWPYAWHRGTIKKLRNMHNNYGIVTCFEIHTTDDKVLKAGFNGNDHSLKNGSVIEFNPPRGILIIYDVLHKETDSDGTIHTWVDQDIYHQLRVYRKISRRKLAPT